MLGHKTGGGLMPNLRTPLILLLPLGMGWMFWLLFWWHFQLQQRVTMLKTIGERFLIPLTAIHGQPRKLNIVYTALEGPNSAMAAIFPGIPLYIGKVAMKEGDPN
jgi:hypothetical protein